MIDNFYRSIHLLVGTQSFNQLGDSFGLAVEAGKVIETVRQGEPWL